MGVNVSRRAAQPGEYARYHSDNIPMASTSSTRIATVYLVVHGLACVGWWIALVVSETWRREFVAPGWPDEFQRALGLGAFALCGSLGLTVAWNLWGRPIEERDLEARFGDAFRRYRDSVRCWWPRLRGFAELAR